MAFASKADLKSSIGNWLERAGDSTVTGNADDFISLAESRINRDLRLNAVEASSSRTGTPGSRSLTVPAGFIAPIALYLTTYGDQTYLRPFVIGTGPLSDTNGVPEAWALDGQQIALDCPCDQPHTFSLRYRGSLKLAGDADANWLLENHPDVYLAASLVEAYAFLHDVQNGSVWDARYRAAVTEVNEKEARARSKAILTVDPALTGRSGAGYSVFSDQ